MTELGTTTDASDFDANDLIWEEPALNGSYHNQEAQMDSQVLDAFFIGAFGMLAVVATFRLIKALSRWLHGS